MIIYYRKIQLKNTLIYVTPTVCKLHCTDCMHANARAKNYRPCQAGPVPVSGPKSNAVAAHLAPPSYQRTVRATLSTHWCHITTEMLVEQQSLTGRCTRGRGRAAGRKTAADKMSTLHQFAVALGSRHCQARACIPVFTTLDKYTG